MNLWNFKASFYQSFRIFWPIRWIFHGELENLKNLIQKISLPKLILDIGTGCGSTLSLFPEDGKIIALDYSIQMLFRAQKGRNGLLPVAGDAISLPIKGNSLPFVSAIGVTEYFPDKSLFMNEVERIISYRGFFLVTVARRGILNGLRNLLGHRVYTVQLKQWENSLFKNGWIIVERCKSLLQNQYLLYRKYL